MNNSDSKHASIHDIISQNKKQLKAQQINQLFQIPQYPNIDLNSISHNPIANTNPMFKFFIRQLEKWTQKVEYRKVLPFSNTQFHKNLFIYNTLKKVMTRNKIQIQRQLGQLHKWYTINCSGYMQKNRQNNFTPSVTKNNLFSSKQKTIDQQWQVRKTFKSNQPLEFLFPTDQDKENNLLMIDEVLSKVNGQAKNNNFMDNQQLKTSKSIKGSKKQYGLKKNDQNNENSLFLEENSKNKDCLLMRIKNDQLRKQRQAQQIQQAKNSWNKTCSRFNQRSSQNFYQGFSQTNRSFYPNQTMNNTMYSRQTSGNVKKRNIKTAQLSKTHHFTFETNSIVDDIKKYRIQTSQSRRIRPTMFLDRNRAQIQKNNQQNNKIQQINKDQTTQVNWIDKFKIDLQFNKINQLLTSQNQYGKGLMSNPFDLSKKAKKKKK